MLFVSSAYALETRKAKSVNNVANRSEVVKRVVNSINEQGNGQVLSARAVKSQQGLRVKVKFLSEDGVISIILVDPGE